MSNNQKRILCVPVMAVGHVNATIGLAKPLLKRGHQVAFLIDSTYKDKIAKFGFKEIVYEPFYEQKTANPGDDFAKKLLDTKILGQKDGLKQLEDMINLFFKADHAQKNIRHWNEQLKKAIEEFQPDLFITDASVLLPEIYYSSKPWIRSISTVPLFQLDEDSVADLPPSGSGFSIDSDRTQWIPYQKLLHKLWYSKEFNDMIEEAGYDRYPNDISVPPTQSLTVYAFPEEYNYPQIRDLNLFNIEVFNKNETQETVDLKELLPKEFYEDDLDGKWSGKWIYVSMGSMGSADLDLMHRLIDALSKTNHKYIVSKGPRYQEYELARNMWGDRYLPQTKILPLVDLVITHGGNNTVTETFAQGKPLIIFPLFAEQPDNAQRLHETGFGIRLDPHSFTEQQLLESVERLLNDEDLKQRLSKASKRILTTNKHEQFADLVDQILAKH